MYLTKLMNKNSQQVKPEPEQPEFSKEEYAAMKKAEREQLWERIDTLTADVLKDAESLHGFLDFAAQCSPERIENLLLFHADAPEATWMKTFDEWKEAGRGVRSGIRRKWHEENGGKMRGGFACDGQFIIRFWVCGKGGRISGSRNARAGNFHVFAGNFG